MKRVVAAVAVAALLAGCGRTEANATVPPTGSGPSEVTTFQVPLPDGRTVLCVWARSGNAGGASCDWPGAA